MKTSKVTLVLPAAAVICLAVSFVVPSEMLDGLGKALAGVFLILFFIVRFFGESAPEEPIHGRPAEADLSTHSKKA